MAISTRDEPTRGPLAFLNRKFKKKEKQREKGKTFKESIIRLCEFFEGQQMGRAHVFVEI